MFFSFQDIMMIVRTDWARWVALCTVNALLFHLFTRDSAPTGAVREQRLLEGTDPWSWR
jgi:hypothetical protein